MSSDNLPAPSVATQVRQVTRPRGDVVIRRFLDGATLTDLAWQIATKHGWRQTMALEWIEQAIRRAFERARSKGKKR